MWLSIRGMCNLTPHLCRAGTPGVGAFPQIRARPEALLMTAGPPGQTVSGPCEPLLHFFLFSRRFSHLSRLQVREAEGGASALFLEHEGTGGL